MLSTAPTPAAIHTLPEHYKLTECSTAVVAVEAFNLFNHSNYGSYSGLITFLTYGCSIPNYRGCDSVAVEWRPQFTGVPCTL